MRNPYIFWTLIALAVIVGTGLLIWWDPLNRRRRNKAAEDEGQNLTSSSLPPPPRPTAPPPPPPTAPPPPPRVRQPVEEHGSGRRGGRISWAWAVVLLLLVLLGVAYWQGLIQPGQSSQAQLAQASSPTPMPSPKGQTDNSNNDGGNSTSAPRDLVINVDGGLLHDGRMSANRKGNEVELYFVNENASYTLCRASQLQSGPTFNCDEVWPVTVEKTDTPTGAPTMLGPVPTGAFYLTAIDFATKKYCTAHIPAK